MRRRRRSGNVTRILLLSAHLLAANRLRTALSMLTVLVGAGVVTLMVAVAAGAERRILRQVRALGTDLLIVSSAPAPRLAARQRQVASLTTLRPADAQAIADEAAGVRAAAAVVSRSMVLRAEGRNTTAMVTGTTTEGLGIRNIATVAGRRFDEAEDREMRRVAIVGQTVWRNLFDTGDPVGRYFRLGNTPFEVIGIVRRLGTDAGGTDLDNAIIIPLGTAMRRVLNIPYVHALYVQGQRGGDLDALEIRVRSVLERLHSRRSGVADPFVIQNQAVLLRTERGAARALHRLTIAAAVLGLLVGGVGILAVMLVLVRERVREIGVRRAVGATRRDVRLQFLMESSMIAIVGGGAGVATAGLLAGIASLAGRWELALSWGAAAVGVLCSAMVGIGAGVYPAERAARLHPIRALRAE